MRKSALAVAALILVAMTTPAYAGWTFKQSVRGKSDESEKPIDMESVVQIQGDNGRVDMEKMPESPIFGHGSYILLRAAAPKGMFIVNVAKETWARFDPEELGAMMGPMMQQGPPGAGGHGEPGGPGAPGAPGGTGIKMSVENAKIEKLLEEPGEPIQGYPTRHYRYHKSYDMVMDMGMMNLKMIMSHDVVEDVWLTEHVHIDAASMTKVMKGMSGIPMAGEMKKLAAIEAEAKGFMLRRMSKDHTTKSGTGMMAKMIRGPKESNTVTTIDVTDIHEVPIADSIFAIPSGYTETQLMTPGAKAPDLEGDN